MVLRVLCYYQKDHRLDLARGQEQEPVPEHRQKDHRRSALEQVQELVREQELHYQKDLRQEQELVPEQPVPHHQKDLQQVQEPDQSYQKDLHQNLHQNRTGLRQSSRRKDHHLPVYGNELPRQRDGQPYWPQTRSLPFHYFERCCR